MNKSRSAEARLAAERLINECDITAARFDNEPENNFAKDIRIVCAFVLAATPDKPSASHKEIARKAAFDCGGQSTTKGVERIILAAIQAAHGAPSQDRLDEEWDKGFNTAEEQYKKAAAAPSGTAPSQVAKTDLSGVSENEGSNPSRSTPSENMKRLLDLLEDIRPTVMNAAHDPTASPWQKEIRLSFLERIDAAIKEQK